MTGFSPAVRRLIRTRAGDGDPFDACCEACAFWLGEYGGQIQHIVARGKGGSRYRNGAGNGALLCGTVYEGCHGECEKRRPKMRERGFWRYSSDVVIAVDHSRYGLVFLLADGSVSREAPEVAA
jgi:hypothetical protein